ncbi:MAG: hypothetical protein H0U36_01025 [Nocardioidaceae bacterium]|nr:hypothetical protein [Nocardioidaceae bacterium]
MTGDADSVDDVELSEVVVVAVGVVVVGGEGVDVDCVRACLGVRPPAALAS